MHLRLLIGLGLILSACTHTPTALNAPSNPASFWQDQKKRNLELTRLWGKIRLLFESKETSVRGRGQFHFTLPHFANLDLRDPLGRTAFSLSLRGQQFEANYPRENLQMKSSDGGRDYFRKNLGISLLYEDILKLSLGILPNGNAKEGFDTETLKVTFDPQAPVIRSIEKKVGKKNLKVYYDDFAETSQVWLAHSVRIEIDNDAKVEWIWESLSPWEKDKAKPNL